jgi:MYXO-CTERM domain-containing protein
VNTHGTDPLDADSDDGGVIDGEECSARAPTPSIPPTTSPAPMTAASTTPATSIDDVGLPKGGGGLSCATTTSQPWWAGVVAALGALWARRKRAA